jgi:hypothetical protein
MSIVRYYRDWKTVRYYRDWKTLLFGGRLGWPQSQSGRCGERKILHCQESNPGSPASSLSLYRLSHSLQTGSAVRHYLERSEPHQIRGLCFHTDPSPYFACIGMSIYHPLRRSPPATSDDETSSSSVLSLPEQSFL